MCIIPTLISNDYKNIIITIIAANFTNVKVHIAMHWLLTIVLTNFIRFALEELTLVMLVSYITFNYFPSSEKTEKQLPG